jgi:hypothetical protein
MEIASLLPQYKLLTKADAIHFVVKGRDLGFRWSTRVHRPRLPTSATFPSSLCAPSYTQFAHIGLIKFLLQLPTSRALFVPSFRVFPSFPQITQVHSSLTAPELRGYGQLESETKAREALIALWEGWSFNAWPLLLPLKVREYGIFSSRCRRIQNQTVSPSQATE